MRIAISPDENPGDPGAVHSGIIERDVNIAVAEQLLAALKRCGQDAWFNPDITFEERVAEANKDGSSLLVACAHNAAGSPAAEGSLFLFCKGDDDGASAKAFGKQMLLAEKCGQALVAGGLFAEWNIYIEDVYECCVFNSDTLYCEFGYETNPTDVATIKQPDYPHRAAELLCQGIAAAEGFAYAPEVHPTAPPPEWKQNLQQLPAPLSGILSSPVDVINTISNEKVSELPAGSTLTVAFETTVRGASYYMTQFAVDHATGYAIAKSQVTFQQPPAPVYHIVDSDGPLTDVLPPSSDLAAVKAEADRVAAAKPGDHIEVLDEAGAIVYTSRVAPQPPQPQPPQPQQPSLVDQLVGLADRELIALLEAIVKEFGRRSA